jgi:(R,R)-butanediol dehydrogenase / meso-butanediol dehydrogenase / diacetyl reductase
VLEASPAPPAPGEVQVEVAYVGICGTDLHVLHGAMDARGSPPAIIGHEMSGRVATAWRAGSPATR